MTQNTATAQRPYRSTTHDERYFHFNDAYNRGTVFFRELEGGVYQSAVALCHKNDQFCRKTGRVVARRNFFNSDAACTGTRTTQPTYETALSALQTARAALTSR